MSPAPGRAALLGIGETRSAVAVSAVDYGVICWPAYSVSSRYLDTNDVDVETCKWQEDLPLREKGKFRRRSSDGQRNCATNLAVGEGDISNLGHDGGRFALRRDGDAKSCYCQQQLYVHHGLAMEVKMVGNHHD